MSQESYTPHYAQPLRENRRDSTCWSAQDHMFRWAVITRIEPKVPDLTDPILVLSFAT
jgi:hypothetical protein